jgi:hypothetical protein
VTVSQEDAAGLAGGGHEAVAIEVVDAGLVRMVAEPDGSGTDQEAAHALGTRGFDQHVHDLLGRDGIGVELAEVEREAEDSGVDQMLAIDRIMRQACEQAQNVGSDTNGPNF